MPKLPLISIIVPVFNVEPYLRRCVSSILNQTYKNLEIFLVDDGSPDNCPQICDEYAKIDFRIKVIHKENGGLSDARNVGIISSKGEYLSFVDSDDFISPEFIECLYSSVVENAVKLAVCQIDNFSDSMTRNKQKKHCDCLLISKESALKYYTALNFDDSSPFISACTKLYHRSLFDEVKFPVGKIYEDGLISYKIIDLADNIAFLKNPLYHYYVRGNGIMGQRETHNFMDVLTPYYEAICYFKADGRNDLAGLFYPPLLMREIYRYWIAKVVKKNEELARDILMVYRKDLATFKKSSGQRLMKLLYSLCSTCPYLYTLYRKITPGLVGGR